MDSHAAASDVRSGSHDIAVSRPGELLLTKYAALLPGVLACALLATIAVLLGRIFPLAGGPVIAIVLGVAIAALVPLPTWLEAGTAFAGKLLLQFSIVLLGAQLDVNQIVRGGLASLPVMLGTLIVVYAVAYVAGKALGIDRDLRRLLAIGTGICGGSAIAALSSVIDVDRSDVAYALGTVFFFNIVAVIAFVPIGHALALSQPAFGLWAGTAINDTSSVVAAAFAYGQDAGTAAVVVKLTRTLLIVPIVLFYAFRLMASKREDGKVRWLESMPWFVVWFLVAATLNSAHLIPATWHGNLQAMALFTIVVALAGVGLSSNIERMKRAGWRPLTLGAILWVSISIASLAIAHFARL